jgi:hypothetical protein
MMIIMLISVDVSTLGIDSTGMGMGMDVGIITGGGGVLISYYRPATQFKGAAQRNPRSRRNVWYRASSSVAWMPAAGRYGELFITAKSSHIRS